MDIVKDLANAEKLQALTGSLLNNLLNGTENVEQNMHRFQSVGFSLLQENGHYTDLELEIDYFNSESQGPDPRYKVQIRHSFCLHLTFDWERRDCYLLVGANFGDGFNCYHQIGFDGTPFDTAINLVVKNEPNEALSALINENSLAWHDVLLAAQQIFEVLNKPAA